MQEAKGGLTVLGFSRSGFQLVAQPYAVGHAAVVPVRQSSRQQGGDSAIAGLHLRATNAHSVLLLCLAENFPSQSNFLMFHDCQRRPVQPNLQNADISELW